MIRIVSATPPLIDADEALRTAREFPAPPRRPLGAPAVLLIAAAGLATAFIAGRLSAQGVEDARAMAGMTMPQIEAAMEGAAP